MNKKLIIQRYTKLHGILLEKKEGLQEGEAKMIKELDYAGITNRFERERKRVAWFEKELGASCELEEFKSLAQGWLTSRSLYDSTNELTKFRIV